MASYYAFIGKYNYGIYTSWNIAKEEILGNPGVRHKKFSTKEAATDFIVERMDKHEYELIKPSLKSFALNVTYFRKTP